MSIAFVTGLTGCIGSSTTAYLLDHGIDQVVGFSRHEDWSRIPEAYRDRIRFLKGDIGDLPAVQQALETSGADRIIHLAAFQSPDCQANPLLGFDVNVQGTANLFHAAAGMKKQIERFVFASSAAVYGPRDLYPGEEVDESGGYLPPNLYGYWKTAGEGMAQSYQLETGVPTVSLRLATTYGPGRDKGLTSAPTTALKAASLGCPYAMPYQGREHYHFVDDVGAGFAQAATEPFEGYGAFNLRGKTYPVKDFCNLLSEVSGGEISIAADATRMPFVCDLSESAIVKTFPAMPRTRLRDGIERSLDCFGKAIAEGHLTKLDLN